jgi:uncharacterized phage infection (PIP) family protein YhgE
MSHSPSNADSRQRQFDRSHSQKTSESRRLSSQAEDDDLLSENEKVKHKKEWLFAEMENRLRCLVTELLSPTLRKVTQQESDIEALHNFTNDITKKVNNLFMLQGKMMQTSALLDNFREDLFKLDTKVHQTCVGCMEDVKGLRGELEGFAKNLERKESAILHTQRSLDRCSMELNRLLDNESMTMEKEIQEKLDETRKMTHKMICELEAKIMGLELKQAALTDELWGEETGLARVSGEVKKTRESIDELSGVVNKLKDARVLPEHLSDLRHEVKNWLGKWQEEQRQLQRLWD